MRWQRRGRSRNLEDRRAQSGGRSRMRLPLPGGLGRLGTGGAVRGRRGGGLSIGGLVIALLAMWLLGVDPSVLLQAAGGGLDDLRLGLSKARISLAEAVLRANRAVAGDVLAAERLGVLTDLGQVLSVVRGAHSCN